MRAFFFFFVAAVTLGSAFACGSDDPAQRLGEAGESCQARSDCASGFACLGNVCVATAMDSEGSGDLSGSPASPSAGGRVGSSGESCQRSTDCAQSLACVNNVCTAASVGADGGLPSSGGAGVNESCVTRSDCRDGLVCVQGRCAIADYPLEPTGLECALVECRDPVDCCPAPPQACATLDLVAVCDPVNLSYSPVLCAACSCDGSAFDCVNDRCEAVQPCEAGVTPCPAPFVCNAGRCVRCTTSSDCPAGGACRDNQCVDGCTDAGDCPYFHACQNGGCVEVGCATDRECVAATNAVTARCLDGECRQPCESDLECASPPGQPFNFRGCFDGFCTDLGCGSDEECRIRLGVTPGSVLDAVCRTP